MNPRNASAAIIVGAFLLGGCASPQWTRPDLTLAQVEKDELACQQQAERELSLHAASFYGAPAELYGQNFQPLTRSRRQWISAPGPLFDIDPVRRTLEEDRIADACMRAKGYSL